MKGTEFLKKYGAAVLTAACENQFDTPDEMAENEHLMVELTDDQDAVISSVVDDSGNHVAYVDEYLDLDDFDLDEPCMDLKTFIDLYDENEIDSPNGWDDIYDDDRYTPDTMIELRENGDIYCYDGGYMGEWIKPKKENKSMYKMRLIGNDGTLFAVGDTEEELVRQYNNTAAGWDVPELTVDELNNNPIWTIESGNFNSQGNLVKKIKLNINIFNSKTCKMKAEDVITEIECDFEVGWNMNHKYFTGRIHNKYFRSLLGPGYVNITYDTAGVNIAMPVYINGFRPTEKCIELIKQFITIKLNNLILPGNAVSQRKIPHIKIF